MLPPAPRPIGNYVPGVVAGGLLFSTLLTLILIPVVYEWVEKKKESANVAATASVEA